MWPKRHKHSRRLAQMSTIYNTKLGSPFRKMFLMFGIVCLNSYTIDFPEPIASEPAPNAPVNSPSVSGSDRRSGSAQTDADAPHRQQDQTPRTRSDRRRSPAPSLNTRSAESLTVGRRNRIPPKPLSIDSKTGRRTKTSEASHRPAPTPVSHNVSIFETRNVHSRV